MSTAAALSWRPDADRHLARLARLRDLVAESGLDALVLAPGADLRYFAGFDKPSHERLSALVVRADADPFVVVPALERAGWEGTPLVSALDFRPWQDGVDPYAMIADALPRHASVAVDDHLPTMHALRLAEAGGVRLSLAGALTAQLRQCKDADELASLASIGAANDRVHARMAEFLRPGRTEAQVATDIAAAMIAEGHERADFVIVGSGPNGASPHHSAGDRVIQAGDVVVVDIGGPAASGFFSDSTRTYILETPTDPDAERVHAIVVAAQEAGFQAAVAGATCEAVDAAARAVIEDAGYGEFFITRTGHGLGLEVHEHPYIVRGNEQVLSPGMVFSVEPGIYLPGRFGVRVEDIVAVDAEGLPLRLNHSDRGAALG